MGAGTFFSKVASVDPLAQALHLPGADKYAQLQASNDMPAATGPYAGISPSLAAANAGYVQGGPGANPNYTTPQAPAFGGNFFSPKINNPATPTTPTYQQSNPPAGSPTGYQMRGGAI